MLKLSDREWKEFFIEDIADILSGRDIYEKERTNGNIPYITATANNNGVGYFVGNINETIESNCLSVNRNGSVGYCFYHPYKALYGNDTRKLRPKVSNKYVSLFLSVLISKQRFKYGYGYKMGTGRLKRQKILIPVTNEEKPDWQFMEDYMKAKEQQILKPTIEKLCKHLIISNIIMGGGGKLSHTHWKAFNFTEVFTDIQRGKRLKKADHSEGTTPYISATALNNGVDGFVGNENGVRKFSNCLTVANSGSVGSAFFHQYEFVASDHVTQLKRDGLDKYAYLFMIPLINRLSEKYSFNREINDNRIKREKLILPSTDEGEIDFAFMSSFMKEVEQDILRTTLKFFKDRHIVNNSKIRGGVKWKAFEFTEIFIIRNGFYNKKPPCYEDGNIPFIGASDSNNGFTGFTTKEAIDANSKTGYGKNEPIGRKLFPANAICVTNNGSVGYAYYQQREFTCTHDVNPLYLKNHTLNKYIAMFVIRCIEQQKVCFAYARKWRPKRMVKSRLLLPVNETGNPDWEYMENCMRGIESKQILDYFKTLGLTL